MKRIFCFIIVFVVLVTAYFVYSNIYWGSVIRISDVTKEQNVTLTSKKKYVYSIRIHVSGHIDGEATLVGKHFGPGDIDMDVVDGDWYSNDVILKYEPMNVQSGYLNIRYELYGAY